MRRAEAVGEIAPRLFHATVIVTVIVTVTVVMVVVMIVVVIVVVIMVSGDVCPSLQVLSPAC